MLFVYMCVPVYRVLYSCKYLRVSGVEGILKDPQTKGEKFLSYSPQEWSDSPAAGGEVCPECGPAAGHVSADHGQ